MTQIINFDRGRKIPHIKGMFYFLILSLANAEIVTIYIISQYNAERSSSIFHTEHGTQFDRKAFNLRIWPNVLDFI